MSHEVTIIPAGTMIFEPDGIHQVTLQFKNADDAIVFYEAFKEILEKSVVLVE